MMYARYWSHMSRAATDKTDRKKHVALCPETPTRKKKRKRNKKAFGKLFALYTNSKKYYISP